MIEYIFIKYYLCILKYIPLNFKEDEKQIGMGAKKI
jgi:hypothetical protein